MCIKLTKLTKLSQFKNYTGRNMYIIFITVKHLIREMFIKFVRNTFDFCSPNFISYTCISDNK